MIPLLPKDLDDVGMGEVGGPCRKASEMQRRCEHVFDRQVDTGVAVR
jgi:hypothetical protein